MTIYGGEYGTWTRDLLRDRQALYPTELTHRINDSRTLAQTCDLSVNSRMLYQLNSAGMYKWLIP